MTLRYLISVFEALSKTTAMKKWVHIIGLASGITILTSVIPPTAYAQLRVVPDGSTRTTISTNSADCSADCTITGASVAGGNLFHSFSEFSIPSGVVVTFADNISNNIFARVSGQTQVSTILGSLAVTGNANFFLINPAGIVFGDNASLNLNGGSFITSTAERLNFEDGTQLIAGAPTEPVQLTISAPIGLQFGSTVAPIVNQSQASMLPSGMPIGNTLGAPAGLRVAPFKTLALLGGDLSLEGGHLTALGGQIALGSVGPGSQVSINSGAQGIEFGYEGVQTYQNIRVLDSLIDVGGPGGGEIHLHANEVTLERSGLLGATLGPLSGGEINIEAIALTLSNSAVQAITFTPSQGAAVNFKIDNLSLNNGSVVSAETQGPGDSGPLNIQGLSTQGTDQPLANDVTLNASFIGTEVGAGANGQGGDVTVQTATLNLQDAAILANTFGTGAGGNLEITATQAMTLRGDSQIAAVANEFWQNPEAPPGIGVLTPEVGDAGNIQLAIGDLSLEDGSQVQATTFGNAGNGGQITIHAETATLIGRSTEGRNSGVFSQVEPGQVTGNLPQGEGGSIVMDVERLQLLGGGLVSASALAGGTAGNITIRNADRIEIVGDDLGSSGLFAIGDGTGKAGNIDVTGNQLRLFTQAQITASTQTTDGGNVSLRLAENIVMRDESIISARAKAGGSGGNVRLDTDFLVGIPFLDSDIAASAINGPGGNIQINATGILGFAERPASSDNGTNDIDASSQFGVDGTVTITNPETDPSQGLLALPQNLADLSHQVDQACGTTNSLAANRFTITGRGGLPPTPAVAIRERRLFTDVSSIGSAQQQPEQTTSTETISTDLSPQILEAQGWGTDEYGKLALVHSIGNATGDTAPGHLYANCQGAYS